MRARAVSGPFEDGWNAFNSGDYATALRLWRPLAEQGNAGAQFSLGIMWANGHGVPQDQAEAAKWFRLAAEQGNAPAQASLGVMYANGHGVPQDHAEAAKWFRLAAEQGFAGAQASLGVTYLEGLGLPHDDVQALMWFNLAASRFPPGEDHDRAVQDRDTVAKRMTPSQIAEAAKLAREWSPRGEQAE